MFKSKVEHDGLIQACEERMLNQWRPLQTKVYDGWLLRFAQGYTKRANSISAMYPSTLPLAKKIKQCEQIYANEKLVPVFKITPLIQPADLDFLLEEEGYAVIDETSVKRAELKDLRQPVLHTMEIEIESEPSAEWYDRFCRFSSVTDKHKRIMKQMHTNPLCKQAFFTLYIQGEEAACGLGMVEQNTIGIYDIVTNPPLRNQGLGTQLLLNMLHWGKLEGADYGELAVLKNNPPALKLYDKLGFKEIYSYWYRIKRS